MSFHEVKFPPQIARGAVGGPGFKTTIFAAASGYEQRNIAWSKARGRWQVGHRIKTPAQFGEVLAFFAARMGRAYGFRFKDWLDYRSTTDMQVAVSPTDQVIGTGDGSEVAFQLIKTYGSGGHSYVREINKPVAGTVRVALDAVEQMSGWSVDTTTGVVTFTTPPGADVAISTGFEFDVPARFDLDELDGTWDTVNTRSVPNIPIFEIRV
jgi:uncharacterized protein (TIGR02217 family)